jgi:membrane protease YdiL (CAAX protease family)
MGVLMEPEMQPGIRNSRSLGATVRWVLVGSGGLRAGWRLVLYVGLVAILRFGIGALGRQLVRAGVLPGGGPGGQMQPGILSIFEALTFAMVLIPAIAMGRFERRTLADYGLPWRRAGLKLLATGGLWGLALVSAVIGGIALFHRYDLGRLTLSGPRIVEYGLAWIGAFTLVGLFEEFTFRGYTQFTLASGIGFWPAAIVLSAAFGAAHLANPGEGWVGALQVFWIAMFFCLTLRRTGNLWFAVGAHATFDWGETFLYSVPNSGIVATGHLTSSTLHGDRWLTGGTVGPEGSVICFVCVGIAIALFARLYRGDAVTVRAG